jgi:c-di-GMP-binding flagellar brake protein YcgR
VPVSPVDTKWLWRTRRKFVRHVVEVRFNLTRADGKKLGGWMRDISEGGIGGIVADTLSPGEQVTVEFQLPGQATPIKLNCTIRYSVGTRFGLEFTALNSQHRAAILEACDQLQLAD